MKLSNYIIEDKITEFNTNNSFQYIRARIENNRANSLIILDTLLENSIPLMGDISTETVEDGRKYFGEFMNVSGIFLYKQNIVVTKGTLNFRNKEYVGLEFLANQKIPLRDEATEFINNVNKVSPINFQYKLTPIKQVGTQF